MMDHKERFYATIERAEVDRPACWLGLPDAKLAERLMVYFQVADLNGLRDVLGDDLAPVEMPYQSPCAQAIWESLDFTKPGQKKPTSRTLNAPGFFEDVTDPSYVERFDWPEPEKYIDKKLCRELVDVVGTDRPVLGVAWSAHFQDTWSAFGMENACVQMYVAPDVVRAVTERIVGFYLRANEVFYEATKGKLDAVLLGNDFGSQKGLIVSPEQVREFAMPGVRALVRQAHDYGLKVIYHSCGAISEIIPDFIEAGVDAVHPFQIVAEGMDPVRLQKEFGRKMSFVGGIDTQFLLVHGKPSEVKAQVKELKELFPTGLIVSPSHEAVLPDVTPENVEALFQAVGE